MVLHQDLGERQPHVAGIAKSVQQQHRRAAAAKADVLRAAAHRHLLAVKSRGPRPAICHASSPMNCRVSIAGFAATSKALEAHGADQPKALTANSKHRVAKGANGSAPSANAPAPLEKFAHTPRKEFCN